MPTIGALGLLTVLVPSGASPNGMAELGGGLEEEVADAARGKVAAASGPPRPGDREIVATVTISESATTTNAAQRQYASRRAAFTADDSTHGGPIGQAALVESFPSSHPMCDSMMGVTARSRLELALGQTGRTVTTYLEQLVGEPIDAHERHHATARAGTPNAFGVADGHPLLERTAVLRGRRTAQTYVRAESVLVPSRLPGDVCRQLERGSDPIGRILAREGIEFSRSPLDGTVGEAGPDDYLLARRYRVEMEGVSVMVIAEWFLPALEAFLA